jgi:hypothetical protein
MIDEKLATLMFWEYLESKDSESIFKVTLKDGREIVVVINKKEIKPILKIVKTG